MRRFTLPPPHHTHIYLLYSKTQSSLRSPLNFYQDFFQGKQSQHHDFQVATERRTKWKVREEEWNADNTRVGQNMILSSNTNHNPEPSHFSWGCFILPPSLSPSSLLYLHHSFQACNLTGKSSQCPLPFLNPISHHGQVTAPRKYLSSHSRCALQNTDMS